VLNMYDLFEDDYKEFVLGELTELCDSYYWCLPVSPKPVSPKLGFRVRVGVSANRD